MDTDRIYDLLVCLLRTAIFGALWLLLRRRLPTEQAHLSRRLWQVVLGLAAMPLCALIAVVLLTFQKYESAAVNTLALNQGLIVLPFVLLTSLVLLFAILILSDHERLVQSSRLAELRNVYYKSIQQQEKQVRQLRHDLRKHLAVAQQGNIPYAVSYLNEITGSPALQGIKRFCDNETANVVLTAKAEAMDRAGITADFAVSLSKELPIADTDLAALLGNALDNAIEGIEGAENKTITLRCKTDKGLLMLRVENPIGGLVNSDFTTTKADKATHGFGIPGMREIAERYHGTLNADVKDGSFILFICLMIWWQ